MATTPASQLKLATDDVFRRRIFGLMIQQALAVNAEDPGTANHATRLAYAARVLASAGVPDLIMRVLVNATNLTVAKTTAYDFSTGCVTTDATDAEIVSQIGALWNTFATLA